MPTDKESTTLMGYYNNGGFGDKKLIYRTDIIKQTPPYPVFDNEKYVALAYKYHLIDEKYELKYLMNVFVLLIIKWTVRVQICTDNM